MGRTAESLDCEDQSLSAGGGFQAEVALAASSINAPTKVVKVMNGKDAFGPITGVCPHAPK
jgi:hypothetical protein